MTRTKAIADNATTEHSLIESGRAIASFDGQHLAGDWESEDAQYGEAGALGVVRINVDPRDEFAVGLSVALESEETGFRVGVQPSLTREQTEELIRGLRETLDALEGA